jgi:hypothetical protein
MSVSTTTDPVKTVIDVLNDGTASEWTNGYGTPDFIERLEATQFSTKTNRGASPAIYVWSPADGTFEQMGAGYDAYLEDEIVQCDVWDYDSASRTATIANDVRDIVFDFATDNKQTTKWAEIAPTAESDLRAENTVRTGEHYVSQVTVQLHAYREL